MSIPGMDKEQTLSNFTREKSIFSFFLKNYVDERPWWLIQRPNKGRKRKTQSKERSVIKFIILDLKDGKL